VAGKGSLAYVTCSILPAENEAQRDWFEETFAGWRRRREQRWPISEDGDGFFMVEYGRT
jgi:16S rRNA (cytosine967-C5)-methyltransferase